MTASNNAKQPAAPAGVASAIFVAIHLLQGVGLLLVLMSIVPRYEKLFEDFDTELPFVTQCVIRLSRAAASFWYLFIVLGAALLALDYFVLQTLRRTVGRLAQSLWGVLWLLIPIAIGAFILLAIAVPLLRLTEALQ